MLIVKRYTAAWCQPCKQLAPIFEELQNEMTNEMTNDAATEITNDVKIISIVKEDKKEIKFINYAYNEIHREDNCFGVIRISNGSEHITNAKVQLLTNKNNRKNKRQKHKSCLQ